MDSGVTTNNEPTRLMVVMLDPLSGILQKGEVVPRYYNPGDLFDEVHFVMLNADVPSVQILQPMVGRARIVVHNVVPPRQMFLRSLGWRPWLLRHWARRTVKLARHIRPAALRCYNPWLDGLVCAEVRRQLGIPFVLSLHGNMELDFRKMANPEGGWRGWLQIRLAVAMEKAAIQGADAVICVYKFIEPYARAFGANSVDLIYNAVNSGDLVEKQSYELNSPPRILILGRQLRQKDASPVLDCLRDLPEVHCDLIGTGPMHEALKARAVANGVMDRCRFLTSMPNRELCQKMASYDLIVSVNNYGGVSKVELEAALVGLPIVTNAHPHENLPEVLEDDCVVVAGDAPSYRQAIGGLLADLTWRQKIGNNVRTRARALRGDAMEEKQADVYRRLLSHNSNRSN